MPHCRLTIAGFVVLAVSSIHGQSAPVADHHQHLFSPVVSVAESVKPINADDLIALLDAAGIRRAAVLSVAYILGDPKGTAADEYEKVKAENDWTSAQVARFPERLVGFCSVNPVKHYADAAAGRNLPPREGWAAFRRLRLTEAEFRTIAGNVPPYMRLP